MTEQAKKILLLDAQKDRALKMFLQRVASGKGRTDLPESVKAAFLQGLREGYADGLTDGVELGLDVCDEVQKTFASSGVGSA
jgi:hypothetical protein